MNVAELLLEGFDGKADRLAVVDSSMRADYTRFTEAVRARAAFMDRRGIRPGDRVSILADNGAAYLETYLAAAWIGAILHSPNPHLAPPELGGVLEDAEPKLVLTEVGYDALARKAGAIPTPLADAVAAPLTSGPLELGASAPAQLYGTSGTTGRSKNVILTHGNLVAHARRVVEALEITEADRWAHVAPMFHLADAWAVFAISLVGGAHVLQPRFDAAATLELFERERVTLVNLVPTMVVRCLTHADVKRRDLSAFRIVLSGGAPLEPRWVAGLVEHFGGEYVQTYGMTETSPFLLLGLLNDDERDLERAERIERQARTGRAFPGIELEVVDSDDEHVAMDDTSVGEVRVRGASVTPGYWRRPEATAAAIRNGWLYTGDLATIDATSSVRIVDRKKDMILSGGENVYTSEVERVVVEHASVVDAAVFGLADPEWGERVCCAVTLAPGASTPDLREFCRGKLAGFKLPRDVFVLDELPKTASGKLSKAALRARFEAPSKNTDQEA